MPLKRLKPCLMGLTPLSWKGSKKSQISVIFKWSLWTCIIKNAFVHHFTDSSLCPRWFVYINAYIILTCYVFPAHPLLGFSHLGPVSLPPFLYLKKMSLGALSRCSSSLTEATKHLVNKGTPNGSRPSNASCGQRRGPLSPRSLTV